MLSRKKEEAEVLSAEKLTDGIYEMWLGTDMAEDARPGCFIALYPKNASTLLPRPISICETDRKKGALRIVYRVAGKGTAEFSSYRKGETAEVLGVLGNGYPLEEAEGKQVCLMGGGIGIPPLLELAKSLKNCEKTIVLGYRDRNLFLKEDLEKYGRVLIATEDGSVGVKGNIMDAVREEKLNPNLIYACGPMPMLKAVKRFSLGMSEKGEKKERIPAYISLEERMACGVGACLGCVCKTIYKDGHSHVNNARICTDGPVFPAEDVAILPEDEEVQEYKEVRRKQMEKEGTGA